MINVRNSGLIYPHYMNPLRLVAFNLCFFMLLSGCNSGSNDYESESQELLALEKEAISREFQNDTTFLSSVMDSTFIELSKGEVKRKHEVLKTIYQNNIDNKNKATTLDSFLLEEPVVHLYDNSAVVTFIMHTFRKAKDSSFERRTRFYDVWVKRNDKWKAVTWQASPVE